MNTTSRSLSRRIAALVATSTAMSAVMSAAFVAFAPPAFAQPAAAEPPSSPSSPQQPATPEPPAPAGPAGSEGPGGPLGSVKVGPSTFSKDTTQNAPVEDTSKESKLPWRNSVFIFDQSTSTSTLRLDTPQTSTPFYEWWLSFRPRYYFSDKIYVSARFDFYKEFTNTEQTTEYRANVFGDIWTDAVYATPVPAISKYSKASVGARLKFPTSKESQGQGVYLHGGATTSFKQGIPLRGESAAYLSDAHVGLGVWYDHTFSRATTPTNEKLSYARQDVGGFSTVSDQLGGNAITNHSVVASLDTGLQVTPKLSVTLDMILINTWKYRPTGDVSVKTSTDVATITASPNDTNHGVATWFLASVDYALLDELTLGLGYYNLTNQIGPDGERRGLVGQHNIWWSPDARFFFDITANLDKIYEAATGKRTTKPQVPNKGYGSLPGSFRASQGI